MAETFDLDAARAARREAKGEPPSFVFGGDTFVLPLEIDIDTADQWSRSNTDGLKALFGEEQYERFRGHGPSIDDVEDLAGYLMEAYGLDDLGKSSPSQLSSQSTGKRSRPTSSGTTKSTSAKRVGAKKGG